MKKLGLIGFPLSHSFSYKYFTQKFIDEQIDDFEYVNYPIQQIADLQNVINNNPELIGLNVTIPYKEKVLQYVDFKDEIVSKIHACNTLVITGDNKIKAYNTDVYGFEKSFLKKKKKFQKKALILGTGGASKAVEYVLKKNNISYKFVSRNPKNKSILSYKNIDKNIMNEYLIVINTTPLGSILNKNTFPQIPYDFVTKNHFFYDLVYNPSKTIFLLNAEKRGAYILNGLKMLYLQAEKSWDIWLKNYL